MLSSDLPLCFQFHIQMQNSSLGNLTFLPLLLCLSFFSLPLHGFPLSPLHLIPSCSQFAFSISKCFEANASCGTPLPPPPPLPPPRLNSGTSYLFFLLSIFLLTVSSILHLSLPLVPPYPPGPAYLAPFLFLLDVLFWTCFWTEVK